MRKSNLRLLPVIATALGTTHMASADTFTIEDFSSIADSITDFSDTQGANNWTYGYFNHTFAPGVFTQDNFAWNPANSTYDYGSPGDFANPPWTNVGASNAHPNGDNNGDVHIAVRRYTVPNTVAPGTTLDLSWQIKKQNVGGGNGTTGIVYHNGVEIDRQTVAFNDGTGIARQAPITISPGDTLDLALSPEGVDGTFNDGSDGTTISLALGADNSVTYHNVTRIADSRGDWSTSGTQGENGWSYGYINETTDPGVLNTSDLQWTGTLFDWPAGNPPWTELGQENAHPNGDNNGDAHSVVRRYEVQPGEAGTLGIEWDLAKTNPNGGNGTTVRVFLNGVEIDAGSVAFNDATGIVRKLIVPSASQGDLIDFALSSEGIDGLFGDASDGSRFGASIFLIPEPSTVTLISLVTFGLLFRRRR